MEDRINPNKNKSICLFPWTHVAMGTKAKPKPCCRFDLRQEPNFDDSGLSINNALQSNLWADLRQRMLNSEAINGCNQCYKQEKALGYSMRTGSFKDFIDVDAEKIINNNQLSLQYLEVNLGSFCNLKCRTCDGYTSSHWVSDEQWLKEQDDTESLGRGYPGDIRSSTYSEIDWDSLPETLMNIKMLKFIGGEPMIHPNFGAFINSVENSPKTTINLFTNATYYPKPKVLDKLKTFKRIELCLSVDGFGTINDYVRFPSQWQEVEKNVQSWLHAFEHNDIEITVHHTINAYNVLYLDTFLRWWQNITQTSSKKTKLFLNCVYRPAYISPFLLPTDIKEEAVTRLEVCLPELPKQNQGQVQKTIKSLSSVESPEFISEANRRCFVKYTNLLDQRRGESFERTFPELESKLRWFNAGK